MSVALDLSVAAASAEISSWADFTVIELSAVISMVCAFREILVCASIAIEFCAESISILLLPLLSTIEIFSEPEVSSRRN